MHFLSIFSSIFHPKGLLTLRNASIIRCRVSRVGPYSLWILICCLGCVGEDERSDLPPADLKGEHHQSLDQDKAQDGQALSADEKSLDGSVSEDQGPTADADLPEEETTDTGDEASDTPDASASDAPASPSTQSISSSIKSSAPPPQPKEARPKKEKKPSKCRRGIHKGQKKCKIERGHISLYHINKGKRYRDLHLIDDQQRIIPEAREVMLTLLGDWRDKTQCSKGYTFNYEYKGGPSWRMYKCHVQDRLLWYLYLIGHHFDSEIHILSGLRSNERKSSRHHNGHAVDFKVQGVNAKDVWEYAKRTFPLVGIGYYPKGKFVHLDVGRDDHQAYWVDSSGSGEEALYKRGVSQIQRGRAEKSQAGMVKVIKRSLKRHFDTFKKRRTQYERKMEAKKSTKKSTKK